MDLSGQTGALLTKAQKTYNTATNPTPTGTTYTYDRVNDPIYMQQENPNMPGYNRAGDPIPGMTQMTIGGATTSTAPAVDQATQQRTSLQSNIKNLVGQALGIYDTLYGKLGEAAAGQKSELQKQFGLQEQNLQQQFASEMPRIGTAYAGRGAYDSSWRMNAEEAAAQQFKNQLSNLGLERTGLMANLGQKVKEQQAQFQVGQDALNRALAEMATITDVDKLTALQTDIQKRISDLQAQSATLQSPQGFVQAFQQIGGPSDRTGQVKATVDKILSGSASPDLKQSVAAGFIQSAGLTQQEQDDLINYLNTTIDKLTAPATTTPTAPTA